MPEWNRASPGVKFREHPTKKVSGRPDRYWLIYFRRDGKLNQVGLGWSSEGWNLAKSQTALLEFKKNAQTGEGPTSFKEKRALEEQRKRVEEQKQEEERQRLEQERRQRAPFGDMIDSYVAWTEKNKKSCRMDESRCRIHLKPFLGEISTNKIDISTLNNFKDYLIGKSLSIATIRHCFILIRQIFNYHIAVGVFAGPNPVAKGSIPRSLKEKLIPSKLDNQRLRFLSPEEAERLLNELKCRSQTTHDIALLSLRTGARFDEIVSLKGQDLDFFNDRIHIFGKNGLTRQAFMTPDIKAMLLSRTPSTPDELVFRSQKGTKIGQISWAFWRAVKKIGFNNGITDPKQKIVFHTLRHTFASWLAQRGVSLFVIKELMGHQTIEMTMRYAHLLPDTKREAVMRMFNGVEAAKYKPATEEVEA